MAWSVGKALAHAHQGILKLQFSYEWMGVAKIELLTTRSNKSGKDWTLNHLVIEASSPVQGPNVQA
jgi:hypothetical protein